MAKSNSSDSEGAMNLQDLTGGLGKLLEKRKLRIEVAGSPCNSPPSSSPLLQKLQQTCNGLGNRPSARNANPSISLGRGCVPPPNPSISWGRGSRGISPSQSGSSDGSISGSARGFLSVNSRDVGRIDLPTVGSNLPNAVSARPAYTTGSTSNPIAGRGTQPKVGQAGGVGLMPNFSTAGQMLPSTAGRGRNGLAPTTPNGSTPAKVTKKRKRPSRKPPTHVIKSTPECFRADVQELTGCKAPAAQAVQLVRPQPERPPANAVPIDVDFNSRNPPARADSASTSTMSAVRSPAPTVSDRVPEAAFSIHDSPTSISSSSRSSGLNYCMGYDQAAPPFLDYDENLGQLTDDGPQPASDPVHGISSEPRNYKGHEGSTTAATPTGASVKEASPLPSESNRKEGTPREHNCDSGFGLSFPDNFNPNFGSGPNRRRVDSVDESIMSVEGIETYEDLMRVLECDSAWISSFCSPSYDP